jgi:DNA polymerase-3 subunit delta
MKFYLSQINMLLEMIASNKIKALLLYGPDKGYINKVCKLIIKKFDLLQSSIDYQKLPSSQLNLMLNSKNFFAKKEFIKVRSTPSSIDQKMKNVLSGDFLHFVTFIADELPGNNATKKLFETELYLASIGCYHDDEQKIERIIIKKCTDHGKKIQKDAIDFLKAELQGDHQLICNELDKLLFFVNEEENITLDSATKVISHDLIASGDDLCIFFVQKKLSDFLQEVAKLLQQNINEVLIIRALIRYYLNLHIVLSKMSIGDNLDNAIKSLSPPIFFKYLNDFKKNIHNTTIQDTNIALNALHKAEVSFKTKPHSFDFYNDIYLNIHKNTLL